MGLKISVSRTILKYIKEFGYKIKTNKCRCIFLWSSYLSSIIAVTISIGLLHFPSMLCRLFFGWQTFPSPTRRPNCLSSPLLRFIQIFLVFGVDKEDHLRKWELRELGIDLSHLNPTLKLESVWNYRNRIWKEKCLRLTKSFRHWAIRIWIIEVLRLISLIFTLF